jgi:hypothetical protein
MKKIKKTNQLVSLEVKLLNPNKYDLFKTRMFYYIVFLILFFDFHSYGQVSGISTNKKIIYLGEIKIDTPYLVVYSTSKTKKFFMIVDGIENLELFKRSKTHDKLLKKTGYYYIPQCNFAYCYFFPHPKDSIIYKIYRDIYHACNKQNPKENGEILEEIKLSRSQYYIKFSEKYFYCFLIQFEHINKVVFSRLARFTETPNLYIKCLVPK